jgi:hypothetical protein
MGPVSRFTFHYSRFTFRETVKSVGQGFFEDGDAVCDDSVAAVDGIVDGEGMAVGWDGEGFAQGGPLVLGSCCGDGVGIDAGVGDRMAFG